MPSPRQDESKNCVGEESYCVSPEFWGQAKIVAQAQKEREFTFFFSAMDEKMPIFTNEGHPLSWGVVTQMLTSSRTHSDMLRNNVSTPV